jgi:hypothetical protein
MNKFVKSLIYIALVVLVYGNGMDATGQDTEKSSRTPERFIEKPPPLETVEKPYFIVLSPPGG